MAKVSGQVELVSGNAETTLAGTCFIPTLRIGGTVMRNACTEPSLFGLLEPGEEVTLFCGRIFWWRWILGVESRGTRYRHGLITFVLGNGVHAMVAGFLVGVLWGLAFGASSSTQESIAWLAGLVAFGLNVKAWLW